MTSDRSPSRTEPRGRVLAAFLAVYIIWGSTYLAIHYAVETIPPFLLGGIRYVLAGVVLYAWVRPRTGEAPTPREWRAAWIVGGLMLLGGNGAVIWAERHVASGTVALIVASVPLWMVLLDWARPHGERPGAGVFLGLALGLGGLVLLVGPEVLASGGTNGGTLAALLVPVAGSLFWAAGSLYSRHGARPRSSMLVTAIQMLTGGICFFAASVVAGEPLAFRPERVATASVLGLLYLVTFGSLIGFTAYVYLLRASSPAKVSTYAYVNPVVAVFLGWLIAGEPVTARTLVAAAVILAGVALITLCSAGSSGPRERGAAAGLDAASERSSAGQGSDADSHDRNPKGRRSRRVLQRK